MELIARLEAMADRKSRHAYDIGDYWNVVEDAAYEIEHLRAELERVKQEANARVLEQMIARDAMKDEMLKAKEDFEAEGQKVIELAGLLQEEREKNRELVGKIKKYLFFILMISSLIISGLLTGCFGF